MTSATRDQRLATLRSILGGCGYPSALVVAAYPIWSPGIGVVRADLVAFTDADQQDMGTSAIVAQVVESEHEISTRWLKIAASVAAPAALFALPDRLVLWQPSTEPGHATELLSSSLEHGDRVVDRLSMLSPETVARVKLQGVQTSLFPIDTDVLTRSRGVACNRLTELVESAIAKLSVTEGRDTDPISAKLVIAALAALMIHDKEQIRSLVAAVNTGVLIDVVQQRYPGYFDWLTTLTSSQLDSYTQLVDYFRGEINFASLEPAMVSDVYENVLIDRQYRHTQGTYYTPPQLARQMLRVIPFEHLEPEQRYVLDPACGSGTMLLAAANRLNGLQPDRIDARSWHRYLTSHLRGYDQDLFATEIAKLSLLMTALPIGNSWHIETRDTLRYQLPSNERPFIMASNPPWRFFRSSESTAEKANRFIEWMLDNVADGGFVACVVPLSWLNRNNSSGSRKALLKRARLLEAWRLPENLFAATRTTTAPAVIVAQKDRNGHARGQLTLMRTVRGTSRENFYTTGEADEAYLVDPGERGDRLLHGPLVRATDQLVGFTTLGAIAAIHNGRPQRPGRSRRSSEDATHRELGSLRALPLFGEAVPNLLPPVRFPDDYDHPWSDDARVRAKKVVVSAKHFSTTNPWRLKVGYDLYGVVLREMFHMILPNPAWVGWRHLGDWQRMCAVMAVLGSGFASCWIDEHEPTRNVSPKRLQAMPFPSEPAQIELLAEIGEQATRAVASGNAERVAKAVATVESTVNMVYRLSSKARLVIARRLTDAPDFAGIVRYKSFSLRQKAAASSPDAADIPSFGQVLTVTEEGLRIWVSGITNEEGIDIEAPLQAPGWLCMPGQDFVVYGQFDNLERAHFGFHRYEWLDDTELSAIHLTRRRY